MKNNSLSTVFMECISVVVLVLVFSIVAFAGTGIGENVFSIGPRATYSTPKDANEGQWSGGAQVRIHLTPGLGLEGSLDYRSNDFGNLTTVKTYPVQASLLAYLMPGAVWSPFLLGGGGWYYTQTDSPGFSDTTVRFGLHAGAGVEFMLNEYISIDGTYRYIWLQNLSGLSTTYQDSGSMVTIALNFML